MGPCHTMILLSSFHTLVIWGVWIWISAKLSITIIKLIILTILMTFAPNMISEESLMEVLGITNTLFSPISFPSLADIIPLLLASPTGILLDSGTSSLKSKFPCPIQQVCWFHLNHWLMVPNPPIQLTLFSWLYRSLITCFSRTIQHQMISSESLSWISNA